MANRDVTFQLDATDLTDDLVRVYSSFLKDDLPRPGRNLRFGILARY